MQFPTTLHCWKFFPVLLTGVLLALASSHVLAAYDTDGLEMYLKLDENSAGTCTGGEDFCDASGSGSSATWSGSLAGSNTTPSWSATVPTTTFTNSYSLNFDGTDDLIRAPDKVFNNSAQIGSIAFWVKTNSASTNQGLFWTEENRDRGMAIKSTGVFAATMYNGNTASFKQLSGGTVDTGWHHLVFTWDITAGSLKLYVDGTLVDSFSGSSWSTQVVDHDPSTFGSIYAITSGEPYDGYSNLDGYMDDIRVYSRVLTQAEVSELAAGSHTSAVWDGTSGTDWEDAGSWNIDAVPDPYTNIIIRDTGSGVVLLSQAESGASLTIESNTYLDLHGYDLEYTDSGELKGGGTLRLVGSETTNPSNIASASTGSVLYYGTGSYTGFATGNSYYNLVINDGLRLYYPFNESSAGSFADTSYNGYQGTGAGSSGGNNTPQPSTDVPPDIAFTDSRSLDFDGTDDYVDIDGDWTDMSKGMTIALWAKPDSTKSWGRFVDIGNGDAQDNFVFARNSSTSQLYFEIYNAASTSKVIAPSGTITNGSWHHYAVTEDGAGNGTLYVDGIKVISGALLTPRVTERANAYIGKSNWVADDYYDGKMDDIRIYSRELQPYEISALASGHQPATASGTFTLNANLSVANDLVLAAGNLDVSGTSKSITLSGSWLNYGGQFTSRSGTVTFEGASGTETLQSGGQAFTNVTINNSSSWTLADLLDVNGLFNITAGELDVSTNNYSVHSHDMFQAGGSFTSRSGLFVLNDSTSQTVKFSSALNELQIEDPTEDGLVGYWEFDECQTDTTADSSGNGNTGTLADIPTWSGSGLPSAIQFDNQCALDFDGSSNYVTVADDASLTDTDSLSISLWFNADTLSSSTYSALISKGTTDANEEYVVMVKSNNVYVDVGNVSGPYTSISTTLTTGEWHNIVVTHERVGGSSSVTVYQDGSALSSSMHNPTNSVNDNALPLEIGRARSGETPLYFDGTIDDVRVYNRVLTPIEARRLYQGRYANGQLSTATVTLNGNLDVSALTILSGKVSASSKTITVSGDWNNYAGSGAFVKGTSTVTLDGSATQNVRGSTDFYTLSVSTSSARSILFGSGTTQYISNALTLAGAASNLLTLGPLTSGIEWFINLAGAATQSVSYVNPSYSNASPGETINPTNSTDGGNNTNWNFPVTQSSGGGGWGSHRTVSQHLDGSDGSGGEGIAYNDTESPDLQDVGIADGITQSSTGTTIGGILDASMRATYDATNLSRRVLEVAKALADRFAQGINEYRIAQNASNETLKTSAPKLDDVTRHLQRAERNVADTKLTKLTASAIGEKRGLLVAMVKSEQVVFSDVPVDSWFAPYVSVVIDEDIATGYEDEDGQPKGEFGVMNPVTYAEMLKMALQSADIDPTGKTPRNTSAQGTWASPYVAQAEAMGLDVFRPSLNVNSPATRGEVIHTLLQVLGLPIAPNAESHFTDLPASHPYAKSIATAQLYGLISGDTDSNGNPTGTVRPNDTINRAEVAKIIALLSKLLQ